MPWVVGPPQQLARTPFTEADPLTPGVLVECDASIKSIIVAIDKENHDYIIEDLDECRVFVKANKVAQLKQKLEEVRESELEHDNRTLKN